MFVHLGPVEILAIQLHFLLEILNSIERDGLVSVLLRIGQIDLAFASEVLSGNSVLASLVSIPGKACVKLWILPRLSRVQVFSWRLGFPLNSYSSAPHKSNHASFLYEANKVASSPKLQPNSTNDAAIVGREDPAPRAAFSSGSSYLLASMQ